MNKHLTLILLIFVCTFFPLYSQAYNPIDTAALRAIDAACDASNQLNWDTEDDPGYWTGVIWDESGRVIELNISSMDLTGTLNMAELTNLVSFRCENNQLSILNISTLTKLTYLDCSNNLLNDLNLTQNKQLITLNCSNNSIEHLNLSVLTKLAYLDCSSNSFHVFDLSQNTQLITLNCEHNNLTHLDPSALIKLTYLNCSFNSLDELDLSKNIELDTLICGTNDLSLLDVSTLKKLTYLSCNYNRSLKTLDVTGAINLETLYCPDNLLSSINVNGLTHLEYIDCQRNRITNLDLSNLISLEVFWCNDNKLQTLDLSDLTKLTTLFCYSNLLTELEVWYNTNLETLRCDHNRLTDLDVSDLTHLNYLYCGENQIKTLNVSGTIDLDTLHCQNNQLTRLDISGLNDLRSVICFYNQISDLNVSSLLKLEEIHCEKNQLFQLDVSQLINLRILICLNNQINVLDVSNNKKLVLLNCALNQISELDVSGLTELILLECSYNEIGELDVSNLTELTDMDCSDNHLPFSSLATGLQIIEKDSVFSNILNQYRYVNQDTVFLPNRTSLLNETIDYTSEALVNDSTTTFIFYKDGNIIETNNSGLLPTNGPGEYYCSMTNPLFPLFALTTATTTILPSLKALPDTLIMSPNAGAAAFDITSSIHWNITCPETWLTYTPFSGTNSKTITVAALPNTTDQQRIAVITITGSGVPRQTVTIIQPPIISYVTYVSPVRCGEFGIITIGLTEAHEGDVYVIGIIGNDTLLRHAVVNNNTLTVIDVPPGITFSSIGVANIADSIVATNNQGGSIQSPALPIVTLTTPGVICENLIQPIQGNPSGGGYTINGNEVARIDKQTLNIGLNEIIYTYTDVNNCSNSDTASMVINPQPYAAIYGEQNLCPASQNIVYSTDNNNQYSYTWQVTNGTYVAGAQPSSITVDWIDNNQGIIQLITSDLLTQCADTASLIISLEDTESPQILNCMQEYHVEAQYSFDGIFYILGEADNTIIPAATDNCSSDGLNYLFSFNGSDNQELQEFLGYRLTGYKSNEIIWTIADDYDNFSTCVTTIFIDENRMIPTAFSPNGDLMNDVWNIKFLKLYPACIVKVFDRWGILIYQSEKGYLSSWDGTKNGRQVPVDTYYYVIELGDDSIPLKGYITVLY